MHLARVTIFVSMLPAAVWSQDLQSTCAAIRTIELGQWAAYEISGEGTSGLNRLRQAVVGTEATDAGPLYWYERELTTTADSTLVQQVLVPSYPFDMQQAQAMIIKQGTDPAVRLPDEVLSLLRTQSSAGGVGGLESCERLEPIGWEEVEVGERVIRALHVRPPGGGTEVWIADVPFGLVKAVEAGTTFLLVDFGEGATSSITEEPVVGLPGVAPDQR